MKILILFILSFVIALTIWIGVSLLAYYLKYCKGDSIVHFINLIEANYDLHQLKVKSQIKRNTSVDLIPFVDVEEVKAEDIPDKWSYVKYSNGKAYSDNLPIKM